MGTVVGLTFDAASEEGAAKKKADWIAEAEELDIEVPSKATIDDIKALIAEATKAASEEGAAEEGKTEE